MLESAATMRAKFNKYQLKLFKPDSPNGFWKLWEDIYIRISNKSEHVNYLLANHNVAMQQNILFSVFSIFFVFSVLNT